MTLKWQQRQETRRDKNEGNKTGDAVLLFSLESDKNKDDDGCFTIVKLIKMNKMRIVFNCESNKNEDDRRLFSLVKVIRMKLIKIPCNSDKE